MLDFSGASSHSHNCTRSNAEDFGSTTNLYPSPQHSSPGHTGIIQEVMFECCRHVGEYFTFLSWCSEVEVLHRHQVVHKLHSFFFFSILHLSFECKYVPKYI